LYRINRGTFLHFTGDYYREALSPTLWLTFTERVALTHRIAGSERPKYSVNTGAFKSFFVKLCEDYNCELNLNDIDSYVVGKTTPDLRYKSDILNGPFDADKLDYIFRDSHFSGLPMNLDLDRLRYSTKISQDKDDHGERRLVVDHGGISALEQIWFNKMQLYPSLYHHQKVRSADCMFKGIIEHIRARTEGVVVGRRNLQYNDILDYLWTDESEFFGMVYNLPDDDPLHELIHDLQYRRLFKRAMVISARTIENDEGYQTLLENADADNRLACKELRDVAKIISLEAGKKGIKVPPEQIWIDLPDPPKAAPGPAYVVMADGKLVSLQEIIPMTPWVELYALYKWQGNVFVPHDKAEALSGIVKDVMTQRYNLTIKPEAFTSCKLNPPR